MISRIYHIEFLTPCFCAGADQTRAELRPSAIRGQLRWWFRSLGGSYSEEQSVFGSVDGNAPTASTIVIRARVLPHSDLRGWYSEDKIPRQGEGPKTYLLGFFCGRTGRLNQAGALAPQSKAEVVVMFRRPPSPRLEQALRMFFSVGALGFRATRAAGAFASQEHKLSGESWMELVSELEKCGFYAQLLDREFADWVHLIEYAGCYLKNKFRSKNGLGISAGQNGSKANALGSATPRQSSVVHLRPVRIDGRLRLALIEAPHSRILGSDAQKAHGNRGPILKLAGLF